MASRYPLPTYEPDTEVPFAMRLAQFLLGASEQLGQTNQNLAQQSRMGQETIEQMDRSDDRKSAIAERQRQANMASADRQAKLDRDAETARTTNKLFADLGKTKGYDFPVVDNPSALTPDASKALLEFLMPKPKTPQEE